MKLTKYGHACFTVEKDDQLLVVDPGGFSTDFIAPENVVAVVITHTHGDHYDHEQLEAIVDKNPDTVIIGNEAVTSQIEAFQTRTVQPEDRLTVGEFTLEFFGGKHAVIHRSIPQITNIAIMINDLIYYPGDSFTLTHKPVDTLALPAAAPWMKTSEAIDFLTELHPRLTFPVHDAILSNEGKAIVDHLLGDNAKKNGIEYLRLESPIDI